MKDRLVSHIETKGLFYVVFFTVSCLFIISAFAYQTYTVFSQAKIIDSSRKSQNTLQMQGTILSEKLTSVSARLRALENTDERVRNNKLETDLKDIKETYGKSVSTYEEILKLRDNKTKVDELEKMFAQTLSYLSEVNYASAAAQLAALNTQITKLNLPHPIPALSRLPQT